MTPDSPAQPATRDLRSISAIDASRIAGVPGKAAARRAWRYASVALVIVMLGVLGSWTHHAIETSLRELRADSLSSMLDAQTQSLQVWIGEKELAARRLARDS